MSETKICKRCQLEKSTCDFSPGQTKCKKCRSDERRERYQENHQTELMWSKSWKKNNPEAYKDQLKRHREKHSDRIAASSKAYYHANRDRLLQLNSEFQQAQISTMSDWYITKLLMSSGIRREDVTQDMITQRRSKLADKRARRNKKAAH